jgi:hypothetical protein
MKSNSYACQSYGFDEKNIPVAKYEFENLHHLTFCSSSHIYPKPPPHTHTHTHTQRTPHHFLHFNMDME